MIIPRETFNAATGWKRNIMLDIVMFICNNWHIVLMYLYEREGTR